MKIFIIEDEPAIREELTQLLKNTDTNVPVVAIFSISQKPPFRLGLT